MALFAVVTTLHAQGPVISEIMARNATTLRDPREFNLEDWIEIHNPTNSQISLTGWFLTDDPLNLTKWKCPSRSVPAGGYTIIYASGRNIRISGQPMHTNFELDGDGEFLALVHKDGTTIQSVFSPAYPKQYPDLSYGRAGNTGFAGYFEDPTPGAANPSTALVTVASKVSSDVPRGRYSAPFQVTLTSSTNNASIRYTTDGSRPTRTDGTLYSGAIPINNTTIVRATAYANGIATSKVATFSYLFYQDVPSQSATPPPGYPSIWGTHKTPWGGTYVRPGDYGMDQTIVRDPAYGPMMMDSLESLPVLSLVAEIDDLFDQATGIYSNPLGEGQLWERPASIEILHPQMARSKQADTGIRIIGRGSRYPWGSRKHSFRLLFKDNYGAKDLDSALFGERAASEHNTVFIRSAYNDSFAGTWPGSREIAVYVRDQFVRDSLRVMGQPSTHAMFCHLYINGMYWGLYNPSERPDAAFQANYSAGKREEWDVLKHFNATVVNGDRVAYEAAYAILQAGVGSAPAYAQVRQYVDVENLADYMIANLFFGTLDWPHNNWYMARRRVPGAGFKFFAWDAELCLWDIHADLFDVEKSHSPAYFYKQLRANPEFRVLFGDRIHQALFNDGPLTTTNCVARFEDHLQRVRLAIVAESARWGDHTRTSKPYTLFDDWEPDAAWEVDKFFPQRPAVFLAQAKAAGLYPSVTAPVFSQHGGRITGSTNLSMTAPGAPAGTIYFTTDGADPRVAGGAVAPSAAAFSSAITLTQDTVVKARVLDGGQWSALIQARFQLPNLVINEVLADNETGITDPAGERDDWIEVANPTNRAIHVSGMFLTDDLREPTQWQFPAGLSIPAGGRLLVWADKDLTQAGVHANFKLSASGEGIFLYDRDGTTQLSGFHFGPQTADVSTGWFEDGGPHGWLVTFPNPTPGASNEISCGFRAYNGRAQDVHPMKLTGAGTGQIGTALNFTLEGGLANDTVGLFYSFGPGYWDGLRPANELSFLLGLPYAGRVWLQTDPQGGWNLPLGLANDTNLIGLRVYFQTFSAGNGELRGSNALELAICR